MRTLIIAPWCQVPLFVDMPEHRELARWCVISETGERWTSLCDDCVEHVRSNMQENPFRGNEADIRPLPDAARQLEINILHTREEYHVYRQGLE